MCEFLLPSIRCAVTGDYCRQSAQMDYLECASRNLGLTTLYDYSAFWCYALDAPYPRPAPPEFDFERDIYKPCPF